MSKSARHMYEPLLPVQRANAFVRRFLESFDLDGMERDVYHLIRKYADEDACVEMERFWRAISGLPIESGDVSEILDNFRQRGLLRVEIDEGSRQLVLLRPWFCHRCGIVTEPPSRHVDQHTEQR